MSHIGSPAVIPFPKRPAIDIAPSQERVNAEVEIVGADAEYERASAALYEWHYQCRRHAEANTPAPPPPLWAYRCVEDCMKSAAEPLIVEVLPPPQARHTTASASNDEETERRAEIGKNVAEDGYPPRPSQMSARPFFTTQPKTPAEPEIWYSFKYGLMAGAVTVAALVAVVLEWPDYWATAQWVIGGLLALALVGQVILFVDGCLEWEAEKDRLWLASLSPQARHNELDRRARERALEEERRARERAIAAEHAARQREAEAEIERRAAIVSLSYKRAAQIADSSLGFDVASWRAPAEKRPEIHKERVAQVNALASKIMGGEQNHQAIKQGGVFGAAGAARDYEIPAGLIGNTGGLQEMFEE